jgi:hypothetical protein
MVVGFIDIVVFTNQVRVLTRVRLDSFPILEERRRPAPERSSNSKIGAKI